MPTAAPVFRAWLACCCLGLSAPARAAAGLEATPLAAPVGQPGGTLFSVMPAEQTGIRTENHYSDPRMWGDLFHEFEVGAIGTGLAIGDYDNDGRPDLFVVSKTESCRLFRNLGDWKFADMAEQAGVLDRGEAAKVWKQGASFADVNNDGWLDLYVCRFNAPNLLYVNQGDGTFREEAARRGLALRDASGMAAFCDYDRDGWLDLFIKTNLLNAAERPDGQEDRLFHNNGDGTFTEVTAQAGISGPGQGHAAIWWDYDADGWPDLYGTNDFAQPDRLYRNQRDGTFKDAAAAVLPHTPYSSMGADLGDVDNDGRLDLFALDMAATTHAKDQRGMAASRSMATRDPTGHPAEGAPQYQRNALLLNTGAGRMREAAFLAGVAASDWSWSVRLEDLDNDGRLDAWITNGMVRELHNTDLLTRMMATENAAERVRIMQNSPPLNEANLAFRNLGDYRFESVGPAWGLDQRGVSFGAATGDLDGDGDLDLVFANYQAGVTVLRNNGTAGHRLVVALRGTVSNRFGVGATARLETAAGVQVRQLVLGRGYASSSEPILHFGLGDEHHVKQLTVTWPSGHQQVFTGLAADQRLTITEPTGPAPAPRAEPRPAPQFGELPAPALASLVSREQPVDEAAMQPLLPLRLNKAGPALALGDLDGDGWPDLAFGGTTRDSLRLAQGAKDGFPNARPLAAQPARVNDGPLLFVDANADGRLDLLVTRGGGAMPSGTPDYQPQLWLGDGTGGFEPAARDALPDWRTPVGAAAAADWDRDGVLDVFLGGRAQPGDYPQPPRSALLLNRQGRFLDATGQVCPELREVGMVTAALWSDVDGDGWIDLLLALDWGTVRYFRNVEGKRFADLSASTGFAAAGAGWWRSLASADFNGDGRPDYATGNLGLNTEYQAAADHPVVLFHGDFKGDGTSQLIEGYHEDGKLYPRRSRRELSLAIPALFRKFPRNDLFARATLEEIFGPEKLAAALRLEAAELRSGVFLSQPDGTYRFHPLPRIAQIAPVHGLAAGDFDGDGHADLYAVQNDFSPVPSIGRFDGGLSQLLRGDGRGGFRAEQPADSGLVVAGDARALVTLDLGRDGWPDFIVSRNDGPVAGFLNRGLPGRSSFAVRLAGWPGNPTAAGARITVIFADGSARTAEVFAGAGYFSQSAADCFFGHATDNPPRQIEVRWPGGAISHTEVRGSETAVLLHPPAR